LALLVTRSAASATPPSSIHSTRAAVSACIASVDGVSPRIAAIATVLSVYEYTNDLAAHGCNATRPKVDAANSRSQMSSSRSSAVQAPSV
jgi:hypothetical protein